MMSSSIKKLKVIGIMTGNSLDAVDAVLTEFYEDGTMKDCLGLSIPMPAILSDKLRHLREAIVAADGHMDQIATSYAYKEGGQNLNFNDVIRTYMDLILESVKGLLAKGGLSAKDVDLIGLHGQTCAHRPPSVAKSKDVNDIYTVQIGDGQWLADMSGIAVVYDSRSDDLMKQGEAAPLAPMHHKHIADQTKRAGYFPIAFCNGGNTGNISLITTKNNSEDVYVLGWDAGPFNHYLDYLMRTEKNKRYDEDGFYSGQGQIHQGLLSAMFDHAVVMANSSNYLEAPLPRSSDPQWYRIIPELQDSTITFADKMRTAAYFSVYALVHSIALVPKDVLLPRYYGVCGGGWKNPVMLEHFQGLMIGDFEKNPILPTHTSLFNELRSRLGRDIKVTRSDDFGFDGSMMEARLFADIAKCRITGEPFTLPSSTGCSEPTVLGRLRFPRGKMELATENLLAWIDQYDTLDLTFDPEGVFDQRWSRASRGWAQKIDDSR